MNLDDWRSRINNLDDEILKLLNQRGIAALRIGELKRQQDLPYFSPEREAQVLDRLGHARIVRDLSVSRTRRASPVAKR